MTNIQVQYWDLQERKRNNMATLEENKRHNIASETISRQRNENDFILGNRNADLAELNSQRNYELGLLNSERNYAVGMENAAIGWQNSEYNYELGKERNEETRTHNIVTEGYGARNPVDYTIYGTQRGGDMVDGTVNQTKSLWDTVSGIGSAAINKVKGWFGKLKYTDQTNAYKNNPLG